MRKSKLLRISDILVKFFAGIVVLIMLSLLFILVHSSIKPEHYANFIISQRGELTYLPVPDPMEIIKNPGENNTPIIFFQYLDFSSRFMYILSNIFVLLIVLLILIELKRTISGIKKYTSFFVNTSRHFKRISFLLSGLLIFNLLYDIFGGSFSMTFQESPNNYQCFEHIIHHFNINNYVTIIIFLTMAFIVTAIFKEGEKLKNENELTI